MVEASEFMEHFRKNLEVKKKGELDFRISKNEVEALLDLAFATWVEQYILIFSFSLCIPVSQNFDSTN